MDTIDRMNAETTAARAASRTARGEAAARRLAMAERHAREIVWYAVITPSVFCERAAARDAAWWDAVDRRAMAELRALAEIHWTSVEVCEYRRG